MTSLIKLGLKKTISSKAGLSPLLAVFFFVLAAQCFAQQSDTVHYEYDRLNRVTKVTYDSSGAAITYTYDAAGNRTATTVQGTNLSPELTSLYPTNVPAGTHGFTLVIYGNNLINGATARWNGSNRTTTYFGSTVTIELTDADLAAPGTFSVVVINPAPSAAQSNSLAFTVGPSDTTLRIDSVTPAAGRAAGGQQIRLTGSFASLSNVTLGGASANWSFTNGSNDTSTITVTTPTHAVGAVSINLSPATGSAYSKPNAFAFLPTSFTDDTLVAGVTTAKAQHIMELRQAVDALRAVAGLGPAPWTEPVLVNFVTQVNSVHIQELRTYLEDAASRLGYPAATYTEPTLGSGSVIKRVHIEELRQRIRNIAG